MKLPRWRSPNIRPGIQASVLATLLILAISGCASPKGRHDRTYVFSELGERTNRVVNSQRQRPHFSLPPGVQLENGVSEEQAVALALWNNAAFQEALAKTGFSRADLVQAGLLANPTFSVLFPLGHKQLEYTATLPLEVLWLRPKRVAVAKLEAERMAETLVQTGLDLVRDVKWAYSDVLLAHERLRFAGESLLLRSNIAVLAEARLRAGDASEWETMTARVDALRAREEAKRLRHEVTLAEHRLVNLIGLEGAQAPSRFNDAPVPQRQLGLDALKEQALFARPDLRAAEIGIEAAGKRAGLAKAEIFALSAALNAKDSEAYGIMYGPGLSLPIPIFNQNQGAVTRAKTELEQAVWNFIKVRDRILLDVKDARVKFQQAEEDLGIWRDGIVTPLKETAAASIKAYEGGDTAYLAVLEANRQLLSAETRAAEVLADLRRAAADLDRSVGRNCAGPLPPAKTK